MPSEAAHRFASSYAAAVGAGGAAGAGGVKGAVARRIPAVASGPELMSAPGASGATLDRTWSPGPAGPSVALGTGASSNPRNGVDFRPFPGVGPADPSGPSASDIGAWEKAPEPFMSPIRTPVWTVVHHGAAEAVIGLSDERMKRPPSWAHPADVPSPGCWCGCCRSRRWWRESKEAKGWRCWTCYPPNHLTPAQIHEERT